MTEARAPVVLATANAGKAAELVELLGGVLDLRPRPLDVPDVVEDAPTLVGNALLKAQALVDATGLAALADDTGLEVRALDGAPGIFSARWAGPEGDAVRNREKLLRDLEGVEDRRACFRAVLVLLHPGGDQLVAEGVVEGSITRAPRGEGGFGYDPLFVPDEGDGLTFAEMASAEKHVISHRGRAVRALLAQLPDRSAESR